MKYNLPLIIYVQTWSIGVALCIFSQICVYSVKSVYIHFSYEVGNVTDWLHFILACWVFFHTFLLSSADFFKINCFKKNLSGILTECQTVWIQIRTDILSVLIWAQTVCKGFQQTTKSQITFNCLTCQDF